MYCSLNLTERARADFEGRCIRIAADGRILHDISLCLPEGVDPEKAKQAAEALNAAFASVKEREDA